MAIEDKDVNGWISKLGITPAPLVQRNIRIALEFFLRQMPSLLDETKEGFLRGIDLHSNVRTEFLQPGATVAAYRRNGEELFKLFYTKTGVSKYDLGIVPYNRKFQKFKVAFPGEVLVSKCASYIYASSDDALAGRRLWSVPGGGRGIQFIIPNSRRCLIET